MVTGGCCRLFGGTWDKGARGADLRCKVLSSLHFEGPGVASLVVPLGFALLAIASQPLGCDSNGGDSVQGDSERPETECRNPAHVWVPLRSSSLAHSLCPAVIPCSAVVVPLGSHTLAKWPQNDSGRDHHCPCPCSRALYVLRPSAEAFSLLLVSFRSRPNRLVRAQLAKRP